MNQLFLFFSIKDPLELSKSNSVAFLYRCESSYVNCKRIFVELKWHATDEQNNALTPADNISATMPAAHSLIDSGKHIVRLLTTIKPYRISYLFISNIPYRSECQYRPMPVGYDNEFQPVDIQMG